MTTSETVLEEAERLTSGDRQRDYASPLVNLTRIAAGWSVILGITVTWRQVAWMMVWLKASRDVATPKRDSVVDAAGYLRLIERCEIEEAEAKNSG